MLLIVALNAVEAAALKKAKEERRKLSELQKHPPKRQGDIYEGPNRDSVYRVSAHYIRKFFFRHSLPLSTVVIGRFILFYRPVKC